MSETKRRSPFRAEVLERFAGGAEVGGPLTVPSPGWRLPVMAGLVGIVGVLAIGIWRLMIADG